MNAYCMSATALPCIKMSRFNTFKKYASIPALYMALQSCWWVEHELIWFSYCFWSFYFDSLWPKTLALINKMLVVGVKEGFLSDWMFLKVKGIVELTFCPELLEICKSFHKVFSGNCWNYTGFFAQGAWRVFWKQNKNKKRNDCFKGCIKRSMEKITLNLKKKSLEYLRKDETPDQKVAV